MFVSEPKWIDLSRIESGVSSGNGSTIGTRLSIACDGDMDLTDDEKWELSHYARTVHDHLDRILTGKDRKIIQQVHEERDRLLGIFPTGYMFTLLPNGYGSNTNPYWSHFPWYQVMTEIGPIIIGWRKRVIVLDWSKTAVEADAETVFPKETHTTRVGRMIHAWSYEKAKEYLTTLREQANILGANRT